MTVRARKLKKTENIANLQHGRRSNFLKVWGACQKCPVRSYCTQKDLLSENQKKRGCEDVRNLYLENVRQWKKPGALAVRNAAEIRTRIQMQNLKDGEDEKLAGKEWLALKKLELEYLKLAERLEKAGKPRNVKVEHSFVGKEDIIELDIEAYDSDTIPDEKPSVHGNLSEEKIEKYKDKEDEP